MDTCTNYHVWKMLFNKKVTYASEELQLSAYLHNNIPKKNCLAIIALKIFLQEYYKIQPPAVNGWCPRKCAVKHLKFVLVT